MQTIITNVGKTAILNSKTTGVEINIASVKVGSTNITPLEATLTDIPNTIWTGNTNNITYIASSDMFIFRIAIDSSVAIGTEMGSIGLYTDTGELFSASNFIGIVKKENPTDYVDIAFLISTNNESIFNLSLIQAEMVRLPTLTDPSGTNSTYNAYVLQNTLYPNPTLLLTGSGDKIRYIEPESQDEIKMTFNTSLAGKFVCNGPSGLVAFNGTIAPVAYYSTDGYLLTNRVISAQGINPGPVYLSSNGTMTNTHSNFIIGICIEVGKVFLQL